MKKILALLITSLIVLASCTSKPPVDIINPDAEYLYFYGASCPHCQELNAIAQERDLYSQIPVEKREVWSNPENNQMFQDLIEELEYEGAGVPFVYDKVTGEVAVWVRPALEMMTARLGNKSAAQEETTIDTQINTDKEITTETQAQ